ncbi:MAG TPA: ATP-dependent DNA helicase RecG [Burkholderiales bacterium]|nr:ATP-dependent DNA helicase RecG [Burkholderiales bacterium]
MKPDKFGKLGLRARFDFLLHLPLRYEDETVLADPASALPGKPVLVEARVLRADIAYRPKRQLIVHAEGLVLRFFNFYPSQLKQFQRAGEQGLHVRAFGEVRGGFFGAEMAHPRYRLVREGEPLPHTLTPVYPTTRGVSQADLRAKIMDALRAEALVDTLPQALRERERLPGFAESIRLLHEPPPGARLEDAWRRVRFDEQLAQQLSLRFAYRRRRARAAPVLKVQGPLLKALLENLPFRLTRAQTRAMNEVLRDLREPHPMQRLLQGDVGSGKTVVAAIACLAAVDSGFQAAVMAPTEILAEQHYRKFSEWLSPLGVSVGWLHGGTAKKARKSQLASHIVVGTHALVQEEAVFDRLGLAVVDEQHRFGVEQRLALRKKAAGLVPHQLMMTATPIPRTLEMTYFADLDVSAIDELPPGRRAVTTKLVAAARRSEVLERIRDACAEGEQVYWVCPVIEESKSDLQTAVDTYETLSRELRGIRIGLLHGRLPAAEKAAIMAAFQENAIQLLVCTTVIEVGVDVPNASLMVIESAERFGLAQLHQLRGRVGRGARQSACILIYGNASGEDARVRLKTIYECNDGFQIAERDLRLRGPGEVLGQRQSGHLLLRYADMDDAALVEAARRAADELIEHDAQAARRHVERWLGSRQALKDA